MITAERAGPVLVPGFEPHEIQHRKTRRRAVGVLDNNRYTVTLDNGKGKQEYQWVVPSKEFYVHHWNWDGATHAMALVHVDPKRAYDELRSLAAAQWENGNIGAFVFNPNEKTYYSKKENWETEEFAPSKDFQSTGITNPPLFGIAVEHVYRNSPDRESAEAFLDEMLPTVMKFHDFLKNTKDPENSGLLTYYHPWETGQDNSPRWDELLERISVDEIPESVIEDVNANRTDNIAGKTSHRPTQIEYYKYMYLVDLYNKWGWDFEKINKESPFAVKDILSSSLWVRSNEALSDMLDARGRTGEAEKYRGWANQTKQALAGTWSEKHQQYCDIDVSYDAENERQRYEPIVKATNAMFMPLIAGAVTAEQLPKVLNRLSDAKQFWPGYPIPSTSLNSPDAQAEKYWRLPTWPIMNLFGIEGLDRSISLPGISIGTRVKAMAMRDMLVDMTLDMIGDNGFFEYYDPERGKARPGREESLVTLGFGDFSWSAATFIYLYEKYKKRRPELPPSILDIPGNVVPLFSREDEPQVVYKMAS